MSEPNAQEAAESKRRPLKSLRLRAKRAIRRPLMVPLRKALVAYARRGPQQADPGQDEKVTILLVSAWGMGGTIRAALNLAGYLAQEREVEIISLFRRRDEPFFGEFPPGVTVTALADERESHRPPGLRGVLYRILHARSSVLVHPWDRAAVFYNLWTDFQLAKALRGRRGYLIATRPAWNLLAAEMANPGLITIGQEQMHLMHHVKPLRRAMPRWYPKLDAFVVLTDEHKVRYDKHLKRGTRVLPIPNTVREMPGAKADLSAPTILTAGRFVYQKGFELLIEAYAPIARDHPDWRVRICGHGHLKERYENLIERHDLGQFVSLEPPAQDLPGEMEKASIFVLSSRFEGFPLILLEAMGKEMAVVAYDCPTGPGEIVDDHRNGLLIPPKDVAALSAGIREMIEDEDLRRRCAPEAGRTSANYTMAAVGPRWDALLSELRQARLSRA